MNIEYGNNRDMKVNSTQILVLRRQKLWSQQHLAEVSGLSLRTIQRVENQSKGSRETITALASVFDLNAAELLVQEKPYPVTDASETKLSVPHPPKLSPFSLCFSVHLQH
jgi:transcriptional regulator with XRE-family HTH domain